MRCSSAGCTTIIWLPTERPVAARGDRSRRGCRRGRPAERLLAGDLDVPAAEARGETDVGAAAADREGELVLLDEDVRGLRVVVERDRVDLRGLEGRGDHHL